MRMLGSLPKPFIVDVVTDRTADAAIATMRLAGLEGADAHELNLPLLAEAGTEAVAAITASVPLPVYTSCRRRAFMRVYGVEPATLPDWDDAERMARQLAAVRAGACAVDIEMDAFAPNPPPPLGTLEAARFAAETGPPAELTDEPAAIARQRETIAAAHALGAEVILSCHAGRPQATAQIVAIARTAWERGADLVKIVTPCRGRRDLYDVLEAVAEIAAAVAIPFTVIGAGSAGLPSRTLGITWGASYAIGQLTLTPGGFHEQPLVAHLRELRRMLPWRLECERP